MNILKKMLSYKKIISCFAVVFSITIAVPGSVDSQTSALSLAFNQDNIDDTDCSGGGYFNMLAWQWGEVLKDFGHSVSHDIKIHPYEVQDRTIVGSSYGWDHRYYNLGIDTREIVLIASHGTTNGCTAPDCLVPEWVGKAPNTAWAIKGSSKTRLAPGAPDITNECWNWNTYWELGDYYNPGVKYLHVIGCRGMQYDMAFRPLYLAGNGWGAPANGVHQIQGFHGGHGGASYEKIVDFAVLANQMSISYLWFAGMSVLRSGSNNDECAVSLIFANNETDWSNRYSYETYFNILGDPNNSVQWPVFICGCDPDDGPQLPDC